MGLLKKKDKPIAKVVSQEEAYWTEIKESTVRDIERLEKLLKFNNAIVEMANVRISNARTEADK